MNLYEVRWRLGDKTYLELRAAEKPEQLCRHIESLAHREWPISDVTVSLPPKK